jgi:predicted outer membrane protein
MTLNKIVLTAAGISVLAVAAFADDGSWNSSGNGKNNMDSASGGMNMPVTSEHFVWEAGAANLKEVRLSELAMDKSQNDDVKSFAKHMIRDHGKANEKLMKIAEKEGLNFPDTNTFSSDSNWNHRNNYNSNWNSNSNNWNSANGMNDMNRLNDTNSPQNASSAGGHENYKGAELLELANETESVSNDFLTIQSLEMLSGPQFDQAYVDKMYRDHVKAINLFQNAAANLQDPDLKKYAEKTLPTLREHYRMVQKLQTKLGGSQNWNSNDYSNSNSGMQMGNVPQ